MTDTLSASYYSVNSDDIRTPAFRAFRAAFSTIMNELAERAGNAGDRATIDLMLAHVPANKVEGAYNRGAYMPSRRQIAQEWADLIMEGQQGPDAFLGLPMRRVATGPGRPAKD